METEIAKDIKQANQMNLQKTGRGDVVDDVYK
jgi:hypothetical protein